MKTPAQPLRNNNRSLWWENIISDVWRLTWRVPLTWTWGEPSDFRSPTEWRWPPSAAAAWIALQTHNQSLCDHMTHKQETLGVARGGQVAVGYRSCCRSSGCSRSGTADGPGRCTPWPPSPASPSASSVHIYPGSRHLWTGSRKSENYAPSWITAVRI